MKTAFMQKIIVTTLILAVFVTLLPLSGEPVAEASPDWKQLYFDEIRAAITNSYSGRSNGWNSANPDRHPSYLSGFMLADLNFDGIPELLIYGDGVSASENMGIFTITPGGVEKIHMDWGNPDYQEFNYSDFMLLQSENDGSLMYRIRSENGGEESSWGTIYLTSAVSPMDEHFAAFTIVVEYRINYEWTAAGGHERTSAVYADRNVSISEFDGLMDSMISGYNLVEYTRPTLTLFGGTQWENLTDAEIRAFLDSYVPEIEILGISPAPPSVDTPGRTNDSNNEEPFTSPDQAGLYEHERPAAGNRNIVNPDRIRRVVSPETASRIIDEVITSLTPEQRVSGDALDETALFVERAVRRGAQHTVSRGSCIIRNDMLSHLAEDAAGIRENANTTLRQEDVTLLRDIRTGATIISEERENLRVEFPDDISDIQLDSVTIEADFVSVTLANDVIHADSELEIRNLKYDEDSERSGESRRIGLFTFWSIGVIILALAIWFICSKLNYRLPSWLMPAICGVALGVNIFTFMFGIGFGQRDSFTGLSRERITDTIEVIMSEGMNATISLPATEAEKDKLVLLNEDGMPQLSKYNPVTGTIDTSINDSGVYILKEFTVDYNDIEDKSEMMKEAISALASRNIMTGNVEGAFSPDDPITRAEFISAAVRVFDMLDHDAVSSFTDISRSDWYYSAVATAEQENILSGFETGTFNGNSRIEKDRMVVVTANMLVGQMGYLVPADIEAVLARYPDRAEIERWSEDGVALTTQSNVLIYRTDGLFAPKSTMTRGDAAILLYRVFNRIW